MTTLLLRDCNPLPLKQRSVDWVYCFFDDDAGDTDAAAAYREALASLIAEYGPCQVSQIAEPETGATG